MTSYLKQHYLHDHKLAQRALLELWRAMRSGRLIAFTGAMTTEAFGYGSWNALRDEFFEDARIVIERFCFKNGDPDTPSDFLDMPVSKALRLLERAGDIRAEASKEWSSVKPTVAFTLIEEVLDQVRVRPEHSRFRFTVSDIINQHLSTSLEDSTDWPADDALNVNSAVAMHRLMTA